MNAYQINITLFFPVSSTLAAAGTRPLKMADRSTHCARQQCRNNHDYDEIDHTLTSFSSMFLYDFEKTETPSTAERRKDTVP